MTLRTLLGDNIICRRVKIVELQVGKLRVIDVFWIQLLVAGVCLYLPAQHKLSHNEHDHSHNSDYFFCYLACDKKQEQIEIWG